MQPTSASYKIIFGVFDPRNEKLKLINKEFQEGESQILRELIKGQFKEGEVWEYQDRCEIALFLCAHKTHPRISLRSEEYDEKHTHEIVFRFDGNKEEFDLCHEAILLAAKKISQAIFQFTSKNLNYVSAPDWKIVTEEYYDSSNNLQVEKTKTNVPVEVRAKMKLPVLYDKLYREVCREEADFFAILDELFGEFQETDNGFYANRIILLQAFKEKRMHLLFVEETDENYQANIRADPLFCSGISFYLLPTFLVANQEGTLIEILWVAKRARRMGLATALIKTLKVKYVSHVLPESVPFWQTTGVEIL